MEVIESGLVVIVVAAIADGVDVGDVGGVGGNIVAIAVGDRDRLAPSVVVVAGDNVAIVVPDPNDVPLDVIHIIIVLPVVDEPKLLPILVGHIDRLVGSGLFAQQLPANAKIFRLGSVDRLGQAKPVRIVDIVAFSLRFVYDFKKKKSRLYEK